MASGIDWFRWHHGSITDPKFQLVAKKSGASVAEVVAVWAFVLEESSMAEERGNHGVLDFDSIDCALGLNDGKSRSIYANMEVRGLVGDGRVLSWDKRQPKREDETAAERKRRQREREHELALINAVTNCESQNVTPCHADVTPCHDRGEERRVEVNPSLYTPIAPIASPTRKGAVCGMLRQAGMQDSAPHYLTDDVWETILAKRTDEEIIEVAKAKMAARPNERIGLKYIAKALLQDPEAMTATSMSHGPPRMSHADKSKLAAARAIFGTEIEGNQNEQGSRIIDVTPTFAPLLGG